MPLSLPCLKQASGYLGVVATGRLIFVVYPRFTPTGPILVEALNEGNQLLCVLLIRHAEEIQRAFISSSTNSHSKVRR